MFQIYQSPEQILIESLIKNNTALLDLAVERGVDVNGMWEGSVRLPLIYLLCVEK